MKMSRATFATELQVPIREIQVGERKRVLSHQKVPVLAESIKEVGLIHRITITESKHLIAGLHRIEAYKSLGFQKIPALVLRGADVSLREMVEIDENLARAELTALERAEHLKRRKELHEALHPEASAGAAQARGMNKAIGNNVSEIISPTFAAEAAAMTGTSGRTVQQEVQIATLIPKDIRDALRNTPVSDKKVQLLKLARIGKTDPDRQRDIGEKMACGEIKAVPSSPHQFNESSEQNKVALACRQQGSARPARAAVSKTRAKTKVDGQPTDSAVVPPAGPGATEPVGAVEVHGISEHHPTGLIDQIDALFSELERLPECELFVWTRLPVENALDDRIRAIFPSSETPDLVTRENGRSCLYIKLGCRDAASSSTVPVAQEPIWSDWTPESDEPDLLADDGTVELE